MVQKRETRWWEILLSLIFPSTNSHELAKSRRHIAGETRKCCETKRVERGGISQIENCKKHHLEYKNMWYNGLSGLPEWEWYEHELPKSNTRRSGVHNQVRNVPRKRHRLYLPQRNQPHYIHQIYGTLTQKAWRINKKKSTLQTCTNVKCERECEVWIRTKQVLFCPFNKTDR